MRVIITRPQEEAPKWVAALQGAGHVATSLPLIAVQASRHPEAVEAAWAQLAQWNALMFVSGSAVEHFFAGKPAEAKVFTASSALKTRAYVTGPGSYAALLRAGVEAHWIDAPDLDAGSFDSEALWQVVRGQVGPGFRVLIVRGTTAGTAGGDAGVGRDWFAKQASDAGATVDFVVAYERVVPVFSAAQSALAQSAAQDGAVWVFSSSEAVANLQTHCPGQSWQRARAVCTHARIAQAAQAAGFGVVRESRPHLPSLIASIESLA